MENIKLQILIFRQILNPVTGSWVLRRNSTIAINKKDLLRD